MPFYEYQCSKCGHHEEVLQNISDKPLTKCPNCGKSALKKLVSAPVFRLKGSGWYETDFKSDKEKKRNLAGPDKEDSSGDAKTEAKAESTAETKTEPKAEAKPGAAKPAPVKSAKAKPKAKPARKAKRR